MTRALATGLRPALAAVLLALGLAPGAAQAHLGAGASRDIPRTPRLRATAAAGQPDVSYSGGTVMHTERTHVIFWAPAGSGYNFDPGYVQLVDTFMGQVAAASHSTGSVFGLMGQYHDAGGPAAYDVTYAGAVIDTNPLPTDPGSVCTEPLPPPLNTGPGWTACVNDSAIQAEIHRMVDAHGLPTGLRDSYVLLTPNGVGSCFGSGPMDCALGGDSPMNSGYCGYHSATGLPGILYAVVPYNAIAGHCQSVNPRPNANTADPAISTIAHELAEVATDPLGDGWSDPTGNEIADKCIESYGKALGGSGRSAYNEVIGAGHYWIQELWSNAQHACEPAALPDVVSILGPGRVAADRKLSLSASAIVPYGKVVSYTWSFGDGHNGRGQQPTHTFLSAGAFTVTVRVTDGWGNWTSASRRITVRRPGRPVVTIERAGVAGPRAYVRFDSDAVVATFECRVDGGPWTPCRSPFRSARLGSGSHRVLVRARDSFGALSRHAATYTFVVP